MVLFTLFILFLTIIIKIMCTSLSQVSCSNSSTVTPSSGSDSLLSPVGSISRPKSLTNSSLCSESATSSVSSLTSNYPKAPGFEREDQVPSLLSSASEEIKQCIIGIYFSYCLFIFYLLFAISFQFEYIFFHVHTLFTLFTLPGVFVVPHRTFPISRDNFFQTLQLQKNVAHSHRLTHSIPRTTVIILRARRGRHGHVTCQV